MIKEFKNLKRKREPPSYGLQWTAHGSLAFTLLEVMISASICALAIAGIFLAYGQGMRLLDGMMQTSRAGEILLANAEFLRTRDWSTLTNLVSTSGGSTISSSSSNLTESITSNGLVCSHLVIAGGDPLNIRLRNAARDLYITGYPNGLNTDFMRKCSIVLSWNTSPTAGAGTPNSQTNTMTLYITKGGMTADITN